MVDKDYWYEISRLKSQIFEEKETNVDSPVCKPVSLLFKGCLPWSNYIHVVTVTAKLECHIAKFT